MSIEQRKIQYEYVKHVAYKLGDLVDQVVFVGGGVSQGSCRLVQNTIRIYNLLK